MTVGSLFSGIGGLELGLEMCGVGPVIWQAECDPYAMAVLEHHWPTVHRYTDVRSIDATAERPDVICGGFPCQDISGAGLGAGIDGPRSGLWVEYARIVRVLRPRFVFVENVPMLTDRGLDRVLGDLASIGFDAEWEVLGACAVGAPHTRERMFILAYAAGAGLEGQEHQKSRATKCRWWDSEPDMARVANGVRGRTHRVRCLGNAVVPQQAALAWQTLTARIARSSQPSQESA